MDQNYPSTPSNAQPQETKKPDDAGAVSPAYKQLSARRTSSFSSLSSLSTCSSTTTPHSSDDSPRSPATPVQYSGVPFSWEKLPGIPKKPSPHKKKDSNDQSLPLPPPTTSKKPTYNNEPIPKSTKNNNNNNTRIIARSFRKDPFFAAFVECGKDEDDDRSSGAVTVWKGTNKVPRTLTDRLGFINMYSSCKTGFAVSESIVYLPRSSSKGSFGLLPRRSTSS